MKYYSHSALDNLAKAFLCMVASRIWCTVSYGRRSSLANANDSRPTVVTGRRSLLANLSGSGLTTEHRSHRRRSRRRRPQPLALVPAANSQSIREHNGHLRVTPLTRTQSLPSRLPALSAGTLTDLIPGQALATAITVYRCCGRGRTRLRRRPPGKVWVTS